MFQAAEQLREDPAEAIHRQLCLMESDHSQATLVKDSVFSNLPKFICNHKINTRGTSKPCMGMGERVQICKKCALSISLAPSCG